jgi:hypothetical protein
MAEGLTWCGELETFLDQPIQLVINIVDKSLLVIGATEVHPVPYRTRSLSPLALMVLGGRPPGRVGHCQETFSNLTNLTFYMSSAIIIVHRGPALFLVLIT